jgi:hypothetical protein
MSPDPMPANPLLTGHTSTRPTESVDSDLTYHGRVRDALRQACIWAVVDDASLSEYPRHRYKRRTIHERRETSDAPHAAWFR